MCNECLKLGDESVECAEARDEYVALAPLALECVLGNIAKMLDMLKKYKEGHE